MSIHRLTLLVMLAAGCADPPSDAKDGEESDETDVGESDTEDTDESDAPETDESDAPETDETDPPETDDTEEVDADGDGFPASTDCADDDETVNPGAVEVVYDSLDNDCSAATRDDDLDGDGYALATDCDDGAPQRNPGATEVVYDGLDNDCSAATRDDDLDGDGFLAVLDCDEARAAVNPSAAEVVYDGLDNDCDAATPDDDLDGDGYLRVNDCDDSDRDRNPGVAEVPYDGRDNDCDAATRDDDLDGDGYVLAADCDDTRAGVRPGAAEVPYDGLDNDCAGGDACDVDGDGHDEDGVVCGGDDCDDGSSAVSPSASEVTFDTIDNDCDSSTPDVVNFWTFADPWQTDDRHDAEVARIYATQTAWVVVYEDDAGARGAELFHTRVSAANPNRVLLTNPSDWAARQRLHFALYADVGTVGTFDAADTLMVGEGGVPMETARELHFVSSTTVEDSAWYAETCTIQQFQENRTDLWVDCRCNEAALYGICGSPADMNNNGYRYGSGPRLASVNNVGREVGGGFLDETNREYIVAMNWKDAQYTQSVGTIWAVDVDTGDRRVVSGTLNTVNGYVTTGAGYDSNVTVSDVVRHTAPLPYLWDVQPGPDGFWYAYGSDTQDNVEIVRVDPVTGDRELVWHKAVAGQGHTMGQCTSDRANELSVQFNERSFTMDPEGNFYLSFHNSSDGDGIVKIDAAGAGCEVIMRLHSSSRPNIGTGYTFQSQNIRGMGWGDGRLFIYTVLGDRLIAVDPATGNRTLISSVQDNVGVGFNSIGENWLVWDDATGLLWTSGGASDQFVAVDPVTGDRQNLLRLSSNDRLVPGGHPVEHETRGPLHPGVWARERFYVHPDNPDHIAMVINGMMMGVYEIHTSNSVTLSL